MYGHRLTIHYILKLVVRWRSVSDGNPKTVTRRPEDIPQSLECLVYLRSQSARHSIYNLANSGMQSRDSLRDIPEMHCKISVALGRCARSSKNKNIEIKINNLLLEAKA